MHVNVNLQFLENDFENIIQNQLLSGYIEEIKTNAIKVQDDLKKEVEENKISSNTVLD